MAALDTDTAYRYSLVIEWSPEDEAFVVTVPDLPGCRTHGTTYEEAVRQAQDAIESWIAAARADGELLPTPRTFTGGTGWRDGAAQSARGRVALGPARK